MHEKGSVGEDALQADALQADALQAIQERDFYGRLLDLGLHDEIEPFLGEVLALIVQISRAKTGYLELFDDRPGVRSPAFAMAHGCTPAETAAIRERLSAGIISEAVASRNTIVLVSALLDPRFSQRPSVRENQIEAVLCAPIGTSVSIGVVYLQGRESPGPFSEADRLRAERFSRHVAVFADRLMLRRRMREASDLTAPYRASVRADGVIGRSAALAQTLREVSLAAPLEVGVLLTGPSGTGKTQLARVIHDSGPRASAPFVELNCAAMPEALLENELFGAVAGAHSTATRRAEGKLAAAEGGTLFLDEIAELSLASQSKLLQLLQSREYYPLGSARPLRADVRLIAATNVDLRGAVARRTFREDLYYRLQVLPIRVPSLAERPEDLHDLAQHFCAQAATTHRLPHLRLSAAAMLAVEYAQWPGNIRELAHAMEAAVIRCAGEGLLEVEQRHIFPPLAGAPAEEERRTFQQATRFFQAQLLRRTLAETSWNVAETARRLGLARSHIYTLCAAFGIERNDSPE
jgi:Nif-specific regulatory protein